MILLQLLGALVTIAAVMALTNVVVDAFSGPGDIQRDAEGLGP